MTAEIVTVSPSFDSNSIPKLYDFIQQTEEINFDLGQTTFPIRIPITENTSIGVSNRTYKQLCIESGLYMIADYAVDFSSNSRKLIDFSPRQNATPEAATAELATTLGIDNYPVPRSRSTIDELSISRPNTAHASISLL